MGDDKEGADQMSNIDHDNPSGQSTPEAPPLPEAASDAIALNLRATYSQLVNAPIPDRFSKLLEELSRSGKPE